MIKDSRVFHEGFEVIYRKGTLACRYRIKRRPRCPPSNCSSFCLLPPKCPLLTATLQVPLKMNVMDLLGIMPGPEQKTPRKFLSYPTGQGPSERP